MQAELIKLLSRVELPKTDVALHRISGEQIIAFNREVALFGYTLGGDVTERLANLSAVEFRAARAQILKILPEITGATANHQVLFNGFPYRTPDQDEYLMRRVIGHLQNAFGVFSDLKNLKSLSCGHFIDARLFDLSQFGACPICQRQVPECTGVDEVKHPFDNVTPLKVLHLATPETLRESGNALLARNSSLSADEKKLLVKLFAKVGLTPPETVFRETLPFVYGLFDDLELTRRYVVGATDVLRIATYISDPEKGDLSLSENTKFRKISTRHVKRLLSLLEGLERRAEDFLRHRERWLRLGEVLHPGSAKNRARFPKTAADFDLLRREPQTIPTFNGEIEFAVRGRMIDERVLNLLSTRPGEFLRRLDVLLRNATDPKPVIAAFERVAPKMTTRALLGIIPYLTSRKRVGMKRAFFPKGIATKVQIVEDKRPSIADEVLNEARAVAQVTLLNRFNELPPMGKVYLDPALMGVVVPFNRRGDASTLVPVSKGSRYPIGPGKVVRMFVHWTGYIDVDLSVVQYDEHMNHVGHIGWTNLAGLGAAHSGDIQSAPEGASEFIDIDLETFRKGAKRTRYVAMSIISYSGNTFDTFPCFAGFMMRDELKSGQRYEPASVRLKFDVSAKTRSHLPLLLDVEKGEIIYADLTLGGGRYGAVANQSEKFQTLTSMMLDLVNTKPTVYDVLALHAMTRGSIVEDPAEADLVFKADEIDLHTLVSNYTV